jgi:hypothetical protein
MAKLCISMKHTTLYTPCIAFMLESHTCTFAIDHVEKGRMKPPEPTPVEGADCKQDQGKPQYI